MIKEEYGDIAVKVIQSEENYCFTLIFVVFPHALV
jgi:hypothetical protein